MRAMKRVNEKELVLEREFEGTQEGMMGRELDN